MSRILPKLGVMILVLLLLLPMVAQAAGNAGVLSVEKGTVKLRRLKTERFITEKDGLVNLEEGDLIHAGSGARGNVFLSAEGQKIAVYPQSIIEVKEASKNRSSIYLPLGKALFGLLNKLRPNQRFEVQTPTAVMGVKGTEFVVGTDGVSKTFVLTVSGVVSLINPEFPNMETLVGKNQASSSIQNSPPTPAVEVPPEVRESAVQGESLESMEALPVQPEGGSKGDEGKGENSDGNDSEDNDGDEETSSTEKNANEDSGDSTADSTNQSSVDGDDATASSNVSGTTSTSESLMAAVTTVQTTTETVEVATEAISSSCPSSSGCGTIRLDWDAAPSACTSPNGCGTIHMGW